MIAAVATNNRMIMTIGGSCGFAGCDTSSGDWNKSSAHVNNGEKQCYDGD